MVGSSFPNGKRRLTRREFIRLAALTAGLAGCRAVETQLPTLTALPSPTLTNQPSAAPSPEPTQAPTEEPTAEPSQNPLSGKAKVAFVKTSRRDEGVQRALALLGINPVQGKKVFLKPNFNSADPAPGSTHPDVLRALVQALHGFGAASIVVGDRSGMGNTAQVMKSLGIPALAEELDFALVNFDELGKEQWRKVSLDKSHWKRGFLFARPALDADVIVQACCLKTHRYGGHFTLSLKNSVGLVAKYDPDDGYNYMTELHGTADQRRMIAEINAAYSPALIVMDGVQAFTNGGPDSGKRVDAQLVLAATDRIAMDAVGAAVLRYYRTTPEVSQGAIFALEQIARAVELGLGVDSPDKIALLTDDADSAAYAEEIRQVLLA